MNPTAWQTSVTLRLVARSRSWARSTRRWETYAAGVTRTSRRTAGGSGTCSARRRAPSPRAPAAPRSAGRRGRAPGAGARARHRGHGSGRSPAHPDAAARGPTSDARTPMCYLFMALLRLSGPAVRALTDGGAMSARGVPPRHRVVLGTRHDRPRRGPGLSCVVVLGPWASDPWLSGDSLAPSWRACRPRVLPATPSSRRRGPLAPVLAAAGLGGPAQRSSAARCGSCTPGAPGSTAARSPLADMPLPPRPRAPAVAGTRRSTRWPAGSVAPGGRCCSTGSSSAPRCCCSPHCSASARSAESPRRRRGLRLRSSTRSPTSC